MRLALLELPARFGQPEEALRDSDRLLAAGPCDLAVLPECALTGYVDLRAGPGRRPATLDFDLARFAEPLDGPTAARLGELARRHATHLVAPLVERDGPDVFNTCVVLDPAGALVARYRKRHPWGPETWATPGDLPHPRVRVGDVTITIAVCFDVHFLAREIPDVLGAVDALIFPSAWVDESDVDLRGPIFERLRRRFGIAVANANWGVGEPAVLGQGRTRFVDAAGAVREIEPGVGARRLDVEVRART